MKSNYSKIREVKPTYKNTGVRPILLLTLLFSLILQACQKKDINALKDRLAELEGRVTRLEEATKIINTDITSLKSIAAALQKNISVLSYTATNTGYTLTMSDGSTIELKNGINGTNGTNGVNGTNGTNGTNGADAPRIGVKKDVDGEYYWTLAGDFLLQNGQKLRVTGNNGTNGVDGASGVTPLLQVSASNYWMISYDNGNTWMIVKDSNGNPVTATGEKGEQGSQGPVGPTGISGFTIKENADAVVITYMGGTYTIPKAVAPSLDKPINLTVTKGIYGSRITISWTAVPLAQKYRIYRFDSTVNEYRLLTELSGSSFDDFSINKSLSKYFYKVQAFNNERSYSNFSDVDYGYTSGKTYYRLFSFGSEGGALNEFSFPTSIETDVQGNIYVSDRGVGQGRVVKFNSSGSIYEWIYFGENPGGIAFFNNGDYIASRQQTWCVQIFSSSRQLLRQWGSVGSGVADFGVIGDIAIDDEQNIWIVDRDNDRVKKYDRNGNLLRIVGSTGVGNGQFQTPVGICYFKGSVFVTDYDNRNVQVFTKDGYYQKSYKLNSELRAIKGYGDHLFIGTTQCIIKTDINFSIMEKIGEGDFTSAPGVAINPQGDVLGVDAYSRKVIVYRKG